MEKLTKKQKKELKKTEEEQKLVLQKKQKKKQAIGIIIGIIAFIALAYFLISYAKEQNRIKLPPVSSRDIFIGQKDAKTQLVEYADLDCPACAQYSTTVEKLLNENKKDFSFVYRFFPLTNIHKNALTSAQATYASHKQEKFLEMYKLLYKNQESWGNVDNVDDLFTGYAKEAGLNIDQFKKDYKSKDTVQFVKDSEQQAINMGLYQTPTFFLNGELIEPKDPNDLEKIVKSKL